MALKNILTLFVFLVTVSCTIINSNSEKSRESTIEKMLELNSRAKDQKPIIKITRDIVDYVEYPLIEVKSNGIIRQILMIPLSTRNGVRYFSSGSDQSLSIAGSLVVKTKGINIELISVDTHESSHLIKKTKLDFWPQTSTRTYHYSNPGFYINSIEFSCSINNINETTVILIDEEINLYKVEEKCNNDKLEFSNKYWVSDIGEIKKSIQWVSPEGIYLEINKLK